MRRGGTSLLEVLVVASLLLLIVGVIHQILTQVVRSSARVRVSGQLHQLAATAMESLEAELQRANAASLSLPRAANPRPYVIALQPVADVADDGSPRYATDFLIAFVWEGANLTRRRVAPAAIGVTLQADESQRLTDAQLNALATAPGDDKRLAVNVTRFACTSPLAPQMGSPLRLELALSEKAVAGNQPETYECRRELVLRNTL